MKKQIRWHQMLKIILLVAFSHFITSCDKDIFDDGNGEGGGGAPGKASRTSSAVATDWYGLQLKMIIKANPSINPILLNRAWGYIGIGLYESVRPGIKNYNQMNSPAIRLPSPTWV